MWLSSAATDSDNHVRRRVTSHDHGNSGLFLCLLLYQKTLGLSGQVPADGHLGLLARKDSILQACVF
jgi:hypothetical protein